MSRIEFRYESHFKEITAEIEREIEKRLLKGAILVHGHVVKSLSGMRSGRIYRVPATKRMYTASAAGEAPAVRLGALRQNYRFETEESGLKTVAIVGNPLKYAKWLEKGTSRMAPRPHLAKAFIAKKREIVALFRGLV